MKNEVKPFEISILVAGVSPDILNGSARALEDAGYRVYRAEDEEAAISLARKYHPDLALLSLETPGMNGMEVCRAIRADSELADLFFIFISSENLAGAEKLEGSEFCASDCIILPISHRELLARVDAAVRILLLNRSLQQLAEEKKEIALTLALEIRKLNESQAVAKVGSWETDLTTLEVTWTEETYRIFETTPQEFKVTHQSFLERVHPEDRQRVDDYFQQSIGYSGSFEIEHRLLFKDGRIKFVQERWQSIFDEGGNPVRAIGTSRDITESKLAQENLIQSQRQYRDLVETSQSVIWSVDVEGRFTFINQACRKVFGRDPEEMIGRSFHDFVPEDQYQANQETLAKMLRDGQDTLDYLNRIRRKDGNIVILNSNARAIRNSQNQVIGISGMSQDTTEFVQAQEKIQQNQSLQRIAGGIAKVGGWAIEAQSNKLYWSEEVFDIFDYPRGEAPTLEEALDFYPEPGRAQLDSAISLCLIEGIPCESELIILTRKGRQIWARCKAEAVRDVTGRIVQVQGAVQDISEQKAAENKIKDLGKRLVHTLESITDALFTLDIEWRFTFLNSEAEKLLQRKRSELLGHSVWDKFPEAVGTSFYTNYRRARESMQEVTFEEYYAPLSRWFEVKAFPSVEGLTVYFHDVTEHRQIREEMRVSEERFRLLAKATNDAIWDWNITTDAIWWNEGIQVLFGYQKDEIESDSRSWINRLHPDEKDTILAGVKQKIDSGQTTWSAEYRFRRSNGTYAHVLDRGYLIRNAEGKALRMVGGMSDVTESKMAAEALAESESRVRLALNAAHMGSFEWNIEEERIVWSRRHEELWGFEVGEFNETFEAFASRVHPEDVARVDEEIRNCMVAREQFVSEFRVIWPNGSLHWIAGMGEFTYNTDGKAVRMNGVAMEITERKTAVEALLASEKEFRNLAEAMPQIVWITSADGLVIYINQHWLDYTGLTLEESLGHGWNKPFHPEDHQRAWDAWQLSVSTIHSYSLECRLRSADGEYRWWLIRAEPQTDSEGNVLKWFGTCTDIHDLKLAELEVIRTNRALKMFSACNEALIHAEAEETLLEQICQTAIDVGGYHMAWVGYAQQDESKSIRPLAWAGAEEGYLSEIKLSWSEDDISGQGPAGRTIRENQMNICEDLEADATFYWSKAARQRGYMGIICLPLEADKRTFGILALYSNQVTRIPTEELQLLKELAEDLAFGIQTLRSRVEKNKLQQAVLSIASGVSSTAGGSFFSNLVRNTIEALDADAGLVAVLESPDNSTARTIAAIVQNQVIDNITYSLKGTPCEQASLGQTCLFKQKVQDQFPNDKLLGVYNAEAYVGSPLIDSNGTIIGLIAALFQKPIVEEDYIPSTLKIFAALAASELERQKSDRQIRNQAAVLDAAHDAILVTDLDDRVIYWNKGAERLFGWTANEVIGRKTSSFLYSNFANVESVYQKALKNGNWEGELQKLSKQGKTILVQASLTLVCDSDGQPTSVLAINSDLTEKKKMESQFLRVQRMESIGTLAGGIAHDLNNVLAPIIMSLEILKSMVEKEEDQELIDTLMSSAQRGADLIKQVLAFARGVEGQRIQVNAKHLVRDIERVMRDTFPKNINIAVNISPQIWTVTGDPTQIHQVILNLCVNARDAMPDGGSLTISMENTVLDDTYAAMNPGANPGSYVIIDVKDSGVGIPLKVRERIFEPFFTTKEVGKGTGLGLSTAMAIVKSHGGFIRLSSKLGKGSRFKVFFPADTADEASVVSIEPTRLPKGNGEVILVVDDEESIRNIAKTALETYGYSVLLAKHGAEAVSIYAVKQNKIAVVLTDMAMPVMDGAALIIALKSMNPKVRIIGSSGLVSNESFAGEVSAGLKHFISKPYTAEVLLREIYAILNAE